MVEWKLGKRLSVFAATERKGQIVVDGGVDDVEALYTVSQAPNVLAPLLDSVRVDIRR